MRGENGFPLAHRHILTGTSPRARGKPPPTHKSTQNPQEHPRVRGENVSSISLSSLSPGTSPRARGKHQSWSLENLFSRNIPACAGKTFISLVLQAHLEEHPRVRGENWGVGWVANAFPGTFPRARGKLPPTVLVGLCSRNIPACAGKTAFL